ncbi:saccharopine dehydrogenase NADP-binding domain-containing protein [Nocardia aobensis]|uniref:saccharopine dehydrogenase NADP-binding domain-containing protein n=1 Tax=Nocardia aobensis TaxID=257277 RepID=UPI001C3F159A
MHAPNIERDERVAPATAASAGLPKSRSGATMRVLVLGGYGSVGAPLVSDLQRRGDTVLVAGRNPERSDHVIDLAEPGLHSYRRAVTDTDVVVNASGAEDLRVAQLATEAGAAFVDLTATTRYVERLLALNPPQPIIVDVGLAPGLSTLLAAAVHTDAPGAIDIAVFLGAGERHGVAATDWTYRLLGRRFPSVDGPVLNYTKPRSFPIPGHGRRRLYRADFSDQHTLTRELDIPTRTYFGVDSRLATAALAIATWIPGAAKLPRGLHFPGGDRWTVLARSHKGIGRWAQGHNQSRTSASIAALAVRQIPELASGVHHLHHLITIADLPAECGIEFGNLDVE